MSTVTDPIADFLARVRNGTRAQKTEMFIPYSKIKAELARILKDEGYISDYSIDTSAAHPRIKITNKLANRTSAIAGLRRVSRPGLRRYVGADEIPRVLGGMGLAILSTSRGVLSGREARKQNRRRIARLRLVILCHESEIKRSRFPRRSKSTSTTTERSQWRGQKEAQLETAARYQGERERQSRFSGARSRNAERESVTRTFAKSRP